MALRTERIHILQYMWRIATGSDEEPLSMMRRIIDDVVAAYEQLRSAGKVGYLMTFPPVSCNSQPSQRDISPD